MSLFNKNPLLKLGLLALVLVGIPAAVFLSQRQAENRSRASQTAFFSFAPTSTQASPVSVQPGGSVTLDFMVEPGSSWVSFIKTEISYDPTKFQVDQGGFVVNQQTFPTTIQGPIYSSGKVSFAISVGADGTKAIRDKAKVGSLTLKALAASGVSTVSFASNSEALSIDPSSTPKENVVSSTAPAFLSIGGTTSVSPTSPPAACSDNPSDTILVIDKSGSMSVAADVNKITQAKAAAKSYVDILAKDTRNLVGLVSYENTATVNSPLTTNYSTVKTQIDSLTAIGSTCTECAILKANQEIAKSTTSQKKVVVLLTDGKANFIEGGANQVETALAEQKALAAAVAGRTASGTVFYTIGLGQEINSAFLTQIANSTGGKYFPSPTADQLNAIYKEISEISGLGSVTGFVFNDANNNKVLDANEAKLSGWTLELYLAGVKTSHTVVSDTNGFNITGLCNGNYTLKEVVKSGWKPTVPVNPNEYSIVINNGNAITDRNFGNKEGNTCADGIDNNDNNLIDIQDPICHTDGDRHNPNSYDPDLPERQGNTCADDKDNNNNGPIDGKDPICFDKTCSPGPSPLCEFKYNPDLPEGGGNDGTNLSLTVLLHGIGNSGDNVNPTLHTLSNKDPLHKTRKADVFIYNTDNQLVSSASGEIKYASASGDFKGTVVTKSPLTAGKYNIRVRSTEHLTRLIGTHSIIKTGPNQLSPAYLVAGDVIEDNKLNILDYNILIGCNSIAPDPTCTGIRKFQSDLDDNGIVDIKDYNLFLREIANQPGE